MQKKFGMIASLLAALAVALGAFGAHGLKAVLSDYQLAIFKTGVQYQFYHVFALFIVAIALSRSRHALLSKAAWAFCIGIGLFSGSLYILACKDLLGISNTSLIGPLTPLGGLSFIIGWILLLLGIQKSTFHE